MDIDVKNFERYIEYLSTMIGVRPVGSHGLELSADYIAEMMKENGLSVSFQPFVWEGHALKNVVGTKRAEGAKRLLLFVAHYDSVPTARGAMDNASGVACVLEQARALSDFDSQDVELRFIALAGEEVGCVGSKAYVESMSEEAKRKVIGVFNFDIFVSRFDEDSALVCGTCGGTDEEPSDNIVSKSVSAAAKELDFTEKLSLWSPRNYGHSDHQILSEAGMASANVTIRGTRERGGKLPRGYHSEKDAFEPFNLDLAKAALETVKLAAQIAIKEQR